MMEIFRLIIHEKNNWSGVKKLTKIDGSYFWMSYDKKGDFEILNVGNRPVKGISHFNNTMFTMHLPFYEGDI